MPIVVIFNDLVPDIYLLYRYQVNISSHSQLTPKINQIITLHNFNQSCNVVRGKIKSRRCYLIKQRALQRCSHTNLQETNTLPSDKKKTKGTRQTKGYLSWRQHSETENCDYKVHHPNLESLNWDMKLFFLKLCIFTKIWCCSPWSSCMVVIYSTAYFGWLYSWVPA